MSENQPQVPSTLYQMIVRSAALHGDAPSLHQPSSGGYKIWSWTELRRSVEQIAVGLHELGVRKGDLVVLAADTRAEFYLADMGIMALGGVAAALYTSYPVAEQAKTIQTLQPKAVFAENPKTLATLAPVCTGQQIKWVLLTGETSESMTLDAVCSLGRSAMERDPELLSRLSASVTADDYAILYLTSGATGEPKMGLTRHGAITANLEIAQEVVQIGPGDRTIAFLPSAHITQRLAGEMLPLAFGMPVWFSDSLSKLPGEIREIKPTFFVAPPRVWERIYSSICAQLKKRPPFQQRLFWGALGAALKANRLRREGKPVPYLLEAGRRLATNTIFRTVRARFGGQMRLPISGGAPLSFKLAEFYEAIGMTIVEGYGLTEGGVTHLNPPARVKVGAIGKTFRSSLARIAPDGELLLGGPTLFAGYYNDPEATARVLVDGWLHTGDLGSIDQEGYTSITGRKKEVIVASNGKKIYPARIEGLFKTEPLISQMVLVGDKLPFVSALFTLNPAEAASIIGASGAEQAKTEALTRAVRAAVARANQSLGQFEQIRKFRILDQDFAIERGELTPTMKVRRAQVLQNYKQVIEELYAGKEDVL